MSLGVITSNQNQNNKVSSGSIQDHHHQKNPRSFTQVQERLCWRSSLTKTILIDFLLRGTAVNAQRYSQILTILRQAIKSERPDKLIRGVILLLDNTGLIRPPQSRHSCRNSSGRVSVTLHTVQTSLPATTSFLVSLKRLWGANDSPRRMASRNTCRTNLKRSPGNFTWQQFTALCRSGTSASTARTNISDLQVLISVPRPPAPFFFTAPHTKFNIPFLFKLSNN